MIFDDVLDSILIQNFTDVAFIERYMEQSRASLAMALLKSSIGDRFQ
ncbi:hypothetical protein ZOD2009_02445 [Haladaptatus paucihalophilus DX253]|uniref:Uncharacterized protein n=1 Tax=Haladaptatus paucihalophilus DX253 TaxID=797209 RepID=E7QNH1_HALPU|nr:hypothetical protein ZOD2009_02445 [Haladaptatus paucihalophilus DX253]SHK65592.1 hypothetical protein SAMN05444342_1999 [Haladaptatus paucihalophilus DX253]